MPKATAASPAPKTPAALSAAEVQRMLRAEIDGLRKDLTVRLDQITAMAAQIETLNSQTQPRATEAEIAQMQERHQLEIALLHVLYASWHNGPATGVASFAQQIAMIGDSDLFDAAWYLTNYPSVAAAGLTAKEHYVRSGAFEGHNPGPRFNTMDYYLANPDVARAGWPALVHYLAYGRAEGRAIG
jgi:hypothetical protein